jgi:hypothetical protein
METFDDPQYSKESSALFLIIIAARKITEDDLALIGIFNPVALPPLAPFPGASIELYEFFVSSRSMCLLKDNS